jgi:acyl-CoA reductase-like NAD-dependent aldehyde dehydrogenase
VDGVVSDASAGGRSVPDRIPNQIRGEEVSASGDRWMEKRNPATGEVQCEVARSDASDVDAAVAAARAAQPSWAAYTPVARGQILHRIAARLEECAQSVGAIVALETGKSSKEGVGETSAAVAIGHFMAGEGQRLYGKTTTSGVAHRQASTIRQPMGVAGLIIAANTPIANVAWKVFPALICGNSVVLKAAEDTPATSWVFARIAKEAGLPDGVLNVVQGNGTEAGAPLVAHEDVDVISFTGSSAVGREISRVAGQRLAKVSLELGGKNPLVICDDADLDNAIRWTLASAFSNAGQRCASASRVIVFESIYETFRDRVVEATEKLKVGPTDDDDFGPVINQRQLEKMLAAVKRAEQNGATILTGGARLEDAAHRGGYYMAPTWIEGAEPRAEISVTELFGPIACLYPAADFRAALALANDSPYGLTAAIHTRNLNRAMEFTLGCRSGVASVNGGTHGSEPHMPFGGLKQSGNGSREPGAEALDVYSELKDIYILIDPGAV